MTQHTSESTRRPPRDYQLLCDLLLGVVILLAFFDGASAQTIPDTDADLDALKASIMLANAGKPCARGTCSEVLCKNAIAMGKALDEARIAMAVMLSKLPEGSKLPLKRQMELNKEYEKNNERDEKLRNRFIWSKAFSSAGKFALAAAELAETVHHFNELLESSPDEFFRRLALMTRIFKDLLTDVNAIRESMDELENLYQNPEDKPVLVKIENEKEYYQSLNKTFTEAIMALEEVKRLGPMKAKATLGKLAGKALLKVAEVEQDKLIDELRDIAVLQKAIDANYYLMVREVSRIRDRLSYIQKLRNLVGDVITEQNVCLAKCPDAPGLKTIPDLSATPWEKVLMTYNAKLAGITADIKSAAIRPMIKGGADPKISASPQSVAVGETVSSQYSLAECKDTDGAQIRLTDVSGPAVTDQILGEAKSGAPGAIRFKAPNPPGDYAVKIVDRHSKVLASATFSVVKSKKEKPKKESPTKDETPKKTSPTGFSPGKYQGYREFVYSACQESTYGHKGTTRNDLYLTVAPDSVVMLLGYFKGNTGASNYFESKNGTMNLDGSHMIGGIQDKTGHYFDVSFTYNSVTKEYVGKGTWNSRDYFCNDSYPVTIVLAPVADFHD